MRPTVRLSDDSQAADDHASQLQREQRRAALLMQIVAEQRALLDAQQSEPSAGPATCQAADPSAAGAAASVKKQQQKPQRRCGNEAQDELAADWLSLRRSLDQLAVGLPPRPPCSTPELGSPPRRGISPQLQQRHRRPQRECRTAAGKVASGGEAADLAVRVAGMQAVLQTKEAELLELEAAGQSWLDDAQQLRAALDSTLSALSATEAEKQALHAALAARSERQCRQGNEARSLSSVPCPHPKQHAALAGHRLRLPAPAAQHRDSHSTHTPEVRATQTPARHMPSSLPPAHLDFRATPPPLLALHQQQPIACNGAEHNAVDTPQQQAAAQQELSEAGQADCASSDGGGTHCNADGGGGLLLQQNESVSGSCSPRSAPHKPSPAPQHTSPARHQHHQHQHRQQQQTLGSSGAGLGPDSSRGAAPAGGSDLTAQNRRLRAAVAEAQAERDEAQSQSRGLRIDLKELQQQLEQLQEAADAAELRGRLEAAEEEAGGLRSQLQAAQDSAAEAERQHASALATAQGEAQAAQQQRAGLNDVLTAAQDRLQQLQREVEEQREQVQQARAESQELRSRLEGAAADLAACRAACKQAEQQASLAEQRAGRAEAAAADAHFAAAKARSDVQLTPHSSAALASQAAQLRDALEAAVARAEDANRRARTWESRWEAERVEAQHTAAKADAAEERAAHWARCAGLADVDSPIAGVLSPALQLRAHGSRSRSRTSDSTPVAKVAAVSASPAATPLLQRFAERNRPSEETPPFSAALHTAGRSVAARPSASQPLPQLWQDTAAHLAGMLQPATAPGSAARSCGGIGRFSRGSSGGDVAPKFMTKLNDLAAAAGPSTPMAPPYDSAAAPASARPADRWPAEAQSQLIGPAARGEPDTAACRRQVLQHTPQPAGNSREPAGGSPQPNGSRRISGFVRIKRRHADAAAAPAATIAPAAPDEAQIPDGSPASYGRHRRTGDSSRSPSPRKAAARSGGHSGVPPHGSPSAKAEAETRRSRDSRAQLCEAPEAETGALGQKGFGTSPSRGSGQQHCSSSARQSLIQKPGSSKAAPPPSGGPTQRWRQHTPLQPLQVPASTLQMQRSLAADAGFGGNGRVRSRISVDASTTAHVLKMAGRLRAASADRDGSRGRRQRSASVEDDLDEVTAILNQLRHR